MDEQPRLTDLVPLRLGSYFLALLAGLGLIAGLEGLYAWMPRLASVTADGRIAAIDLGSQGNLGVWFSSMTLALAGLMAILVYLVRRHRKDDYHGRYRVWLWAAFCWFLMSLDKTACLHEGFKELMSHLTGARILGDGSIWWVACYFCLLGAVGTRLLIDMRECWLSAASLVVAAVGFALAAGTQLGLILPDAGVKEVMAQKGGEMIADLFVLLAMGLHARHVILDAEGLLGKRKKRLRRPFRLSSRAYNAGLETAEGLVVETVPAEVPIKVRAPRSVALPTGATLVTTDTGETAAVIPTSTPVTALPNVHRKLSKAERKALNRQMREQRDQGGFDG